MSKCFQVALQCRGFENKPPFLWSYSYIYVYICIYIHMYTTTVLPPDKWLTLWRCTLFFSPFSTTSRSKVWPHVLFSLKDNKLKKPYSLGFVHVQSGILSSPCLRGYVIFLFIFFNSSACVLSTRPVNAALCGDIATSQAGPRGRRPLCHSSSPCCWLSMLDMLPGLLHCHGWHTIG